MRYTKDLIKSGFTAEQANTAIKVLLEIMDNKFSTKSDIDLVRKDIKFEVTQLRSEMKELKSEMKSDIQRLDQKIDHMGDKLTIRLSGVMVVLFSIFGVLTKMI
tara:strand:+ start:73 stop:384 length:312 start_codon:yes stop_codon:yes gene_type:complete